jgi:hypothetical protein
LRSISFLEVGERFGCVYQFTGHPERRIRSARPRMARVGHGQRAIGAKAVDPRIHLGRGRVIAGSDRSSRALDGEVSTWKSLIVQSRFSSAMRMVAAPSSNFVLATDDFDTLLPEPATDQVIVRCAAA